MKKSTQYTDQEVMRIVQNHAGVPWFNGEAWAAYRGYNSVIIAARDVANELREIVEEMREEKLYKYSDRLREYARHLDYEADYVNPRKDLK